MMVHTLEKFELSNVPNTVIYVPDFISIEEEFEILKKVYTVPKPKWTCLKNRRLQNWGGIPHPNGMIPETVPDWLAKYVSKVQEWNVFPQDKIPNHILINEYLPGQGIMPHTDGPLFHPIVSTISCGSHTVLNFKLGIREDEPGKTEHVLDLQNFSILLEPRSLLVLKNSVYENYLHSIDEVESDTITDNVNNLGSCSKIYPLKEHYRNTRISLTIRHVPKVCRVKLKF